MDLWQVILLAIIQGLTEFLPISSSAHLILLPQVTDWPDQGLVFDVALHIGTLAAVLAYFRRDLAIIVQAWLASIRDRRHTPESRLGWGVILGTVPVGLAGVLFGSSIETNLRSPLVIAAATIGFALLLWWADRRGSGTRDEYGLDMRAILLIGIAQALALIPGTSRSGVTLMAGLMLGLTRQGAARFSFLLSIPVIALAGGWQTVRGLRAEELLASWTDMLLGAVVSGIIAYWTIHFFIRLLSRVGMTPFVVYRVLLGVLLLAVFY